MTSLATRSDEETLIMPVAEFFDELMQTMPPEDQLHFVRQRMEADRYKLDRRVESTRRDITNLGLGPAQA